MLNWRNVNLGSLFGLRAGTSRLIALALIVIAVLLATPPSFTPDDFINIALAQWLAMNMQLAKTTALALTYTLIPFVLFMTGILFYPYNTGRLFDSAINKIRSKILGILHSPLLLFITAGLIYYSFTYYVTILK